MVHASNPERVTGHYDDSEPQDDRRDAVGIGEANIAAGESNMFGQRERADRSQIGRGERDDHGQRRTQGVDQSNQDD